MLASLLIGAALADDALYAAVERSDLAAVERALDAGAHPEDLHATTITPGRVGRFFGKKAHDVYDTPLHEAVSRAVGGNPAALAVLERLVARAKNVDITTDDVGTPLSFAVGDAAQNPGALPVVALLLKAGAVADEAADRLGFERAGAGPLPDGEAAVLKLLLASGARPATVLCGAAGHGDELLALHMLDAGVPVDTSCGDETPLFVAVYADRIPLAKVLIGRGADRAAVASDGDTLFDGFGVDVQALLDAAPVDARTEAALIVGWSHEKVDPAFVATYSFVNVGRELASTVVYRGGAAAFIDAYAAVGGGRLAGLVTGPFAAPITGSSWTWGCPLTGGVGHRDVEAWVPGSLSAATRRGPIVTRTWDGGEAGFLRGRLGMAHLVWLDVPPECDAFAGAAIGLPRGVVRVALGPPVAASATLDVWSARDVWAWSGRQPWYVVAYVDGVATASRVEWRRW